MLKDMFMLYAIGVFTIAIVGIIFYSVIVIFNLEDRMSPRIQASLSKGDSWWLVLAAGLAGCIVILVYPLFTGYDLLDKNIGSLVIIAMSPLIVIVTLSLSGYLILSLFNLRGLGQKLGILMGAWSVVQFVDLLIK